MPTELLGARKLPSRNGQRPQIKTAEAPSKRLGSILVLRKSVPRRRYSDGAGPSRGFGQLQAAERLTTVRRSTNQGLSRKRHRLFSN